MKTGLISFTRGMRAWRWGLGALGLWVGMAVDASAASGNYPKGSPVARHGALQVRERQLCDQAGKPVLLRGMSTHDLKLFGRFATREGVRFLAKEWQVTVMRPALYVTSFREDPSLEQKLDLIVEACEENGIYCIIDWHVLFEHDPLTTQADAIAFFKRKAARYRDKTHVIYEICNEPNGADVTWAGSVKPFAEAVIPVIRQEAPGSIVIVGTPTWSQDVDVAAQDPLAFENVLYAIHFYVGTHGAELREKVRVASNRVALFCSEWGTTLATGDGGPYPYESKQWMDFLESFGISWCNWSLSDANEASALLRPGASDQGGWTDADLTDSGRFVKYRLLAPPAR